jgi:mono/diheme cytochrome c family protein
MFVMWKCESVSSEQLAVSSQRRFFGVRWQAQRDTAVDQIAHDYDPKRRRRFALPAHSKLVLIVLLLTAHCLLLTSACRRDMQDQPKAIAYRESKFYKDGTASRPLVEGTVPRGFLRQDREFYFGKKATAQPSPALTQTVGPQASSTNPATLYPDDVETFPMPITKADIDRGQERYNIYCSVCHGLTGNGDGMVARRGFNKPAPASYHQDRLRQAPVGHFFDVMSNGWGAMPAYASQIPVEDRWRIIAYIRALQLSQMPKQTNQPAAPKNGGSEKR